MFEVAPVVELSGIGAEVVFENELEKFVVLVVVKLVVVGAQKLVTLDDAAITGVFPKLTLVVEEVLEQPDLAITTVYAPEIVVERVDAVDPLRLTPSLCHWYVIPVKFEDAVKVVEVVGGQTLTVLPAVILDDGVDVAVIVTLLEVAVVVDAQTWFEVNTQETTSPLTSDVVVNVDPVAVFTEFTLH